MSYPFFFTWTDQASARPLEVTGGEGAWFTTAAGDRWLDLGSLSYQASLGHGHPRMTEALCRQARSLPLAAPWAVFPAKVELAERLLALAPAGFSKVFFTLGGAEATENAMKIARLATGRLKFVSRYRSYHGATMGALSLTGDYRRPPVEPGLAGVVRVLDDPSHVEQVLDLEGPGTVAAVVLESVPGANGVLIPPADFWPRVRAACDRHGALLVADEVLTGFGRTGRCFGFEHLGAAPDMITVAKGLTGGYAPLGAVLAHERVAEIFEERVLYAGLTSYAHPLGCAAALEALDVYRDDALFDRAARLGPHLLRALASLCERHDELSGARGLGLLAAVDVEMGGDAWERLAGELTARRVHLHASPRRKTAIFAPPLIIGEEELERGVELFGEALAAALGGGGRRGR